MTALAPGTTTRVEHSLSDEPLLSLDALADAADRLTAKNVTRRGVVADRIAPDRRYWPLKGRPGEAVRSVTTTACWVRLGALARLPEYAALLRRVDIRRFELMVRARGERILAEDLKAFVAAPGMTVPVHFDRDHHLLLQICGTKTVGTGTFADPEVARHQIGHGMEPGQPRADVHPDVCEQRVLHAGQGLVIPAFTFHWVENHDDVTIALTCMARTDRTAREEAAHGVSSRLRSRAGTVHTEQEADDDERQLGN
ncbi:MAG: hypothetical protein WD271_07850 [Acidimicrobiia bacterium]